MNQPSARAEIITRRTYSRPLNMAEPNVFETWPETINRVIGHQKWLWERALGRGLLPKETQELEDLRLIMLDRRALTSGRSLWMAGTPKAQEVEAALFNCAFTKVETVYDVVDVAWLLLNGCGVGFEPVVGSLWGFPYSIPEVEYIPSTRDGSYRGYPENLESYDRHSGTWRIVVGDSARGWAKFIGKLVAGHYPACRRLVLDFSNIRGSGKRLNGYGWICAGSTPLMDAARQIVRIRTERTGTLLSFADIHDLVNVIGTILSTRRSAQLCQCPRRAPDALKFGLHKNGIQFGDPLDFRFQSNNSYNYENDWDVEYLSSDLDTMFKARNGEPGIRNQDHARMRYPWAAGTNPCAEILLPNKGFCNLVEINLAHVAHLDTHTLEETARLIARANYRQTCVNLQDGILQRAWHENNENIRLCGVGLTGISQAPWMRDKEVAHNLREVAILAAEGMAKELGLPLPQAVTTIKPSGTLSKIMDCTEGLHNPVAEFLLNNVVFSKDDPLVADLTNAGYRVRPHPKFEHSVLIALPVSFKGSRPIGEVSAVDQLNNYLFWLENWADHNPSCTIQYHDHEQEAIKVWMKENFHRIIGVSFLPISDASYDYLPQEPITESAYNEYIATLKPLALFRHGKMEEPTSDCIGGACPIR